MSVYRGLDGSAFYGDSSTAKAITASSDLDEAVSVSTHGYSTGDYVRIVGHAGSTPDLNGNHVITVLSATKFTLDDIANITVGGTGGTATRLLPIGNLRSWEINSALGVIDTTVKGDKHQTVTGGLVTGTATLTALLDYSSTGQAALVNLLETTSPTGALGTLCVHVITGKTLTVTGLYAGHQIGSPETDADTARFSFITTSAVTIAWV